MAKKTASRLSAAAIAALRASTFEAHAFTLPGRLVCYDEVKAVCELLSGKWEPSTGRHVFPASVDARASVLALCDAGELPPSNALDFYPTPSDVIEEIMTREDVTEAIRSRLAVAASNAEPVRFLEPSAGSGALLGALRCAFPEGEGHAFELNPDFADKLRARFPGVAVHSGDFLASSFPEVTPFDFVLMNPPFARKTYQKHVRRAFDLLRPFGVLVAIVPASFHTDPDFAYFVGLNGGAFDLGPERFENTKIPTAVLILTNDPDHAWREKPCGTFSTHHAWNLDLSIYSDADMIRRLQKCTDFDGAFAVLADWTAKQVRQLTAARIDRSIAIEALRGLIESEVITDRLLPMELRPVFDLVA